MAAPKLGSIATYGAGPFTGVRNTREPFDDTPDALQSATNVYFPDPVSGCAAYIRPGFALYNSGSPLGASPYNGQGGFCWVKDDGTVVNVVAFGGILYEVDPTDFTNINPSSYTTLYTGGRVFFAQLANELVVSDGSNPPFLYSTGEAINYEDPTVILSASGVSVAYTAFVSSSKNPTTHAAVPVSHAAGTKSLAAGTIPADQWGIYRFSVTNASVFQCTAGAANFGAGYATEAAAIAAKPALPASTDYDMGYITVKTAAGQPFVGGTDGLQGTGVGAHPALTTNYYAGAAIPWSAYGRPTVYEGSMFFIVNTVGVTSGRTSITWCEPNQPTVGYHQGDLDDVWTLSQAGPYPLYAIQGTNVGLFYARQGSWGVVSGTPSVDFRGQATGDLVSQNIGCVSPASVDTFGNYLYFADQQGRPCRFPFGGAVEQLWLQMREDYDDIVTGGNPKIATPGQVETYCWGIVDPTLNLYLCAPWKGTTAAGNGAVPPMKMYGFDAASGRHIGYWAIQNATETTVAGMPTDAACILRDSNNNPTLTVLGYEQAYNPTKPGMLWAMSRHDTGQYYYWGDGSYDTSQSRPTVRASITTPWLGYSMTTELALTKLRVNAYKPSSGTSGGSFQWSIQTSEATIGPFDITLPVSKNTGLAQVPMASGVIGRGAQVTLTQTGTITSGTNGQVQLMRIEVDGTVNAVTQRDA